MGETTKGMNGLRKHIRDPAEVGKSFSCQTVVKQLGIVLKPGGKASLPEVGKTRTREPSNPGGGGKKQNTVRGGIT